MPPFKKGFYKRRCRTIASDRRFFRTLPCVQNQSKLYFKPPNVYPHKQNIHRFIAPLSAVSVSAAQQQLLRNYPFRPQTPAKFIRQEPFLPREDPTLPREEPFLPWQGPLLLWQESLLPWEDTLLPREEPLLLWEAQSLPGEEPSLPWEDSLPQHEERHFQPEKPLLITDYTDFHCLLAFLNSCVPVFLSSRHFFSLYSLFQ